MEWSDQTWAFTQNLKLPSAVAMLSTWRLITVPLIIQQGSQGHTGHPGEPGEPGQTVRSSSKTFTNLQIIMWLEPLWVHFLVRLTHVMPCHHCESSRHLWDLKRSGFLFQGPRWCSWTPWTRWQSWRGRTYTLFKGLLLFTRFIKTAAVSCG